VTLRRHDAPAVVAGASGTVRRMAARRDLEEDTAAGAAALLAAQMPL
jgi:hypothetical protein